jgi:hypothetical protein
MAAIDNEFSLVAGGVSSYTGVHAAPVQNVTNQVAMTVDGEGLSIYNVLPLVM